MIEWTKYQEPLKERIDLNWLSGHKEIIRFTILNVSHHMFSNTVGP